MGYPAPNEIGGEPEFTAVELLREIRKRGGRIIRMREVCVVCLTTNPDVASWLKGLGAKSFMPPGLNPSERGPIGGYIRDHETQLVEWDFYIHTIPVKGDESIFEMSAPHLLVEMKS